VPTEGAVRRPVAFLVVHETSVQVVRHVSLPVRLRVFPDGLGARDPDLEKRTGLAYAAEWRSGCRREHTRQGKPKRMLNSPRA